MAAIKFAFNKAKAELLKGTIDLVADTIKMAVLGSATNATTNKDAAFLTDFTLDEPTDASYARQTLASKAVTQDDTANRSEWDFDDPIFSSDSGGDVYSALLVYKHVGADSANIPLFFYDAFSVTPDGVDLKITIGADGFLHLVDA